MKNVLELFVSYVYMVKIVEFHMGNKENINPSFFLPNIIFHPSSGHTQPTFKHGYVASGLSKAYVHLYQSIFQIYFEKCPIYWLRCLSVLFFQKIPDTPGAKHQLSAL